MNELLDINIRNISIIRKLHVFYTFTHQLVYLED